MGQCFLLNPILDYSANASSQLKVAVENVRGYFEPWVWETVTSRQRGELGGKN
jgi:hypothetical protein